jgi:hypothetical protein
VTNGTVVPNGKNLQCLAGGVEGISNLFVRISNYGDISVNKDKLIETLKNIGAQYAIHDCMKNKWGDLGSPNKRNNTIEQLKERFSKCTARKIFLIFDGKIYTCGRAPHLIKMGFSPSDDFCVDLLNSSKKNIRKNIELLQSIQYIKACDYCDSRIMKAGFKEVEPAIQFTMEEIENLKLKENRE